MSSVGSSPAIDGSLGANMSDSALFWVERLSHGVGLQVIQQGENVLARLLRPSTVGVFHVFAHSMVTGTSSESPERNDLFVSNDILHVFDSFEQIQSSARSGCLIRVLKVSSQVINSALSRYIKQLFISLQSFKSPQLTSNPSTNKIPELALWLKNKRCAKHSKFAFESWVLRHSLSLFRSIIEM